MSQVNLMICSEAEKVNKKIQSKLHKESLLLLLSLHNIWAHKGFTDKNVFSDVLILKGMDWGKQS